MKLPLSTGSLVSLLMIICLGGCESETEQSLDKYYPVRNVKLLEIGQATKTDFFIGMEKISIPLNAKAFDGGGSLVAIPGDLVHFTSNGKTVTGDHLEIEAEGAYRIVAHIGNLGSDTLTIRALDSSKLSLHISVDDSQKDAFIADGKAALDFKAELFHHGEAIPLSSEFAFYCNSQPLNGRSFTTRRAGLYKFKATGGGLTSNEITLEAASPVKKLRLSKKTPDVHFFGYNISETAFLVEGLDEAGQPVALSEDIALFRDNVEIDLRTKFKSDELGLVNFQARGYKIQSNALAIEVKSPVKTIKLEHKQYGNTFWADGVSEVSFSLTAFDFDGKSVTPTPDVRLYEGSNVVDYSKSFTTTKGGDFRFKARGHNAESNEVVITATAPTSFNIVRIPVIFHEINTTNITEAKVNELLDGVTRAFRNRWNPTGGPKDANSGDLYIEVYAAERDPMGNPLPIKGLDRVKSSKQSFHVDNANPKNEAHEDAANYYWNPNHYYNIWIYPNITGDFARASWAYFPYVTQPLEGIGVLPPNTEPSFPFGAFLNARHLEAGQGVAVTAHEIGHSLALSHVFDGNLTSHNGCVNGDTDYCSDTKPYGRKAYQTNYLSEGYNRVSCDGQKFVSTNIMDYYIGHENSFTLDQRRRVRHAINYVACYFPL